MSPARLALRVLALLALGTVAFVGHREVWRERPFERYRREARALLIAAGESPERVPPGAARLTTASGTDLCLSCHALILGPRLANAQNPHKAHRGAHLTDHPPRHFGCTACHGGGGEILERCPPARGEGRALGRPLAAASCFRCHDPADGLHSILSAGLRAYRRLGCAGCHRHERLSADPLRARSMGPPLAGVVQKLRRAFLGRFLADPQRLRPGTPMPSFFSDELLTGASSATAGRLQTSRVDHLRELLAFLESLPQAALPSPAGGGAPSPRPPNLVTGGRSGKREYEYEKNHRPRIVDPARGARLFGSLGCAACHLRGGEPQGPPGGLGRVGPDLRDAGARLQPGWMALWLAGPHKLDPRSRMPDFRLSPEQAGDLASHLATLGRPPPDPPALPAALAAAGRRRALNLGCAGCHSLPSLEEAPPVGPALDDLGDRSPDLFDWGAASVPRSQRDPLSWIRRKLTSPLAVEPPRGRLSMPWQALRPGELDGLVLLIRGFSRNSVIHAPAPAEKARLRRGEALVQELGCHRCHELDGRGGVLGARIPAQWDRPPSLTGVGGKVQPAWLRRFLLRPTALRPWLGLRMPTFALTPAQAEELAGHFAARAGAGYPFTDPPPRRLSGDSLREARALFDRLRCLSCHQLERAPRLEPGELAPDLGLAPGRLREAWVRSFILDPQRLMPGTKMPELFPLADEDDPKSRTSPAPNLLGGDAEKQLDALVELTFRTGEL